MEHHEIKNSLAMSVPSEYNVPYLDELDNVYLNWSTACTIEGNSGVDDSLSIYMSNTNRKHITVASLFTADPKTKSVLISVANDANVGLKILENIPELFPLFSDPNFKTDIIAIDIEAVYNQEGVNAWNLVNTLDTLIKSTVCRHGTGKPHKRETLIAASASLETSVDHIKDFLTLNDSIIGIYPRGENFTIAEKTEAMTEMLAGIRHIPKKIQDIIKPKKCSCKKDEISLTPRQEQILTLIKERGASNKTIARILNITESTVKLHVGLVLKKFGVKNRTQLALFCRK